MKEIITRLDKSFNNRIRLGIMSILMVNDWIDFKELKELMELTDGNLASHSAALEKLEYIKIKKEFVGKKPRTSYAATAKGRKAFVNHLNALEELIKRS